jgi:hypothetical protein
MVAPRKTSTDLSRGEDAKDDAAKEDDIRLVSRRNRTWQATGPGAAQSSSVNGAASQPKHEKG